MDFKELVGKFKLASGELEYIRAALESDIMRLAGSEMAIRQYDCEINCRADYRNSAWARCYVGSPTVHSIQDGVIWFEHEMDDQNGDWDIDRPYLVKVPMELLATPGGVKAAVEKRFAERDAELMERLRKEDERRAKDRARHAAMKKPVELTREELELAAAKLGLELREKTAN